MKKAVVLLSGGLDSTTVLAIAKAEGFENYALSFDYGQKNRFEFVAAERIAKSFGAAAHRRTKIDLSAFGGSSLTTDAAVEKDRSREEIGSNIPSTYVPARNTIFLSFALAWADVLAAEAIFIGVNAVDVSGYPDCRPEFIAAFEKVAQLGTRTGVEDHAIKIHAPLMQMNKREIIARGLELDVDYSVTMTCYDPNAAGISCGRCDACILRQRAFFELGKVDPLPYQSPLKRD